MLAKYEHRASKGIPQPPIDSVIPTRALSPEVVDPVILLRDPLVHGLQPRSRRLRLGLLGRRGFASAWCGLFLGRRFIGDSAGGAGYRASAALLGCEWVAVEY